MTPTIKFGTDGWRGVIADDFTLANARIVAHAIARYVVRGEDARKGVIIGYDHRYSSDRFATAVAEVISASGTPVRVADKPCPTPAISFLVPHQKRNRRRGARLVRNPHRGPRCADNFGDRSGEAIGGIAVVVTDDHAFARVFAANHIARNRVGNNARVCKREIICNDAAPSVRAKLDRGSHE